MLCCEVILTNCVGPGPLIIFGGRNLKIEQICWAINRHRSQGSVGYWSICFASHRFVSQARYLTTAVSQSWDIVLSGNCPTDRLTASPGSWRGVYRGCDKGQAGARYRVLSWGLECPFSTGFVQWMSVIAQFHLENEPSPISRPGDNPKTEVMTPATRFHTRRPSADRKVDSHCLETVLSPGQSNDLTYLKQ